MYILCLHTHTHTHPLAETPAFCRTPPCPRDFALSQPTLIYTHTLIRSNII